MVLPKQQVNMGSTVKSNDDCYFYYYSSCTKGDECPYRHCEFALGTETVCSLWKEGLCFRNNCKFRHMESRIDRKSIPCYWENQPGGCRKPHCVFFHRKLKAGIPSSHDKLILPVSGTEKVSHVKAVVPPPMPASPASPNVSVIRNESLSTDETDEGIHSPVEPFVVSFDENEESDSESLSNTPVKTNEKKIQNNLNGKAKFAEKSVEKVLDFEIKSLEQIRLEKIHKESENIYKTDFTVPSLEDIKVKRKSLDTDPSYLSTSDKITILPEKAEDDEIVSEIKETGQTSLNKDNDLRSILNQPRKKFTTPTSSKVADPLDFKIKTLDEIRKEKMMKVQENGSTVDSKQSAAALTKHSPPVMRKLKLNRINRTSTPIHNTGKRKNDGLSQEGSIKIIKVESSIPQDNLSESAQLSLKPTNHKDTVHNLLPFLKRNSPTTVSSSINQIDCVENSPVTPESDHADENGDSQLHSEEISQSNQTIEDSMESTCAEADSSCKDDVEEKPEIKIKVDEAQTTKTTNRSLSIDDIDHFLKDTDVDMDDLDDSADAGVDDIMSEINEFLDS